MKRKIYYEEQVSFGSMHRGVALKYIPIIGLYKIIFRNIHTKKCEMEYVWPKQIFDRLDGSFK